jgi:pimeloyl-ACP methyl ester carboxylesterase
MTVRACRLLALMVAVLVAAAPPPVTAQGTSATVSWQACPQYSDEALEAVGFSAVQLPRVRRQLGRMECGLVDVPMDYARPRGRQIAIAVTRLRATDQTHRLGSLAVNPGGPGASGYLMPVQIVVESTTDAALNQRYDLIGLDPRGVNDSTKVDCPNVGGGASPPPGPVTEAYARQAYDAQVKSNVACARHDPDFLAQLTTANVARDLDRVRIALSEATLNYLGVSWGTALGASYRSLFPAASGRMWLDSVLGPDFRLDAYLDTTAEATAAEFSRMAGWIADRNDLYGFGTSAEEVEAGILRERLAYDAAPRRFTDLDVTIDGRVIERFAATLGPGWPRAAKVLEELRDATGPTAPPAVKQVLTPHPSTPPPPGTPEVLNPTMQQAVFCNEDAGRRDFASAWSDYQRWQARFPFTGETSPFTPRCAGWPLSLRRWQPRSAGGPLEMSGHLYETRAPYVWTRQMQAVIGGRVFTVQDDIHGSVLDVPACAAHMVTFLDTGRSAGRGCAGVPVP